MEKYLPMMTFFLKWFSLYILNNIKLSLMYQFITNIYTLLLFSEIIKNS
jgi:hypothetical protein